MREAAERHGRVVLRLKLQEDQQVQPVVPRAHLAKQIQSALDQATADAVGRERATFACSLVTRGGECVVGRNESG